MPRVVIGNDPNLRVDSKVLEQIRSCAHKYALNRLYNSTSNHCSVCGVHLRTEWGEPLGRYFVLDRKGRFYCMNCDRRFGEGDEEIYVPEEDI
jgi:hypothetical protein